MQSGEYYPLLDEVMQQLALICSFASFQASLVHKLPDKMASAAAILSQLNDEHRFGLRDLARLIDSHLIAKGSSKPAIAKPTNERPLNTQYVPTDSESESDEDVHPDVQKPSAAPQVSSDKPSAALSKVSAPASKQAQPEAAPAPVPAANKLQAFADALRTTPSPSVNDGDQRAANKRLQLRNKLKKAHEAAGIQQSAMQNKAGEPEAGPSSDAVTLNKRSQTFAAHTDEDATAAEAMLSHSDKSAHLAEGASEVSALKPSRKMLKRERRKAAAAAAAEAAANAVAEQPGGTGSLLVASDRLSTAEGTSSSSAASLVGSPTRAEAADHTDTRAPANTSGVPPDIAGAAKTGDSKQGFAAADASAALPASLQAPQSGPTSGKDTAGSKPAAPQTMRPSAEPDTKAVANGPESSSAQTSIKSVVSKQETASSNSMAELSKQEAGPTQTDTQPQPALAQVTADPVPTVSEATTFQSGVHTTTNSMNIADSGEGSAASKDTNAQVPKPQSNTQQRSEQLPAANSAEPPAAPPAALPPAAPPAAPLAAPPVALPPAAPPAAPSAASPPAAIAAHRPDAKKVVLRASAAPYTPLSSKAALADKGKGVAPAAGTKPVVSRTPEVKGKLVAPAAIAKPTASGIPEDKGKKVAVGVPVHLKTSKSAVYIATLPVLSSATMLHLMLQTILSRFMVFFLRSIR